MKNPAEEVGLSLSQIQAWNRCRYRWDLEFKRGIGRRPVHVAMDLGSAAHSGMAGGLTEWALTRSKKGKFKWGPVNAAIMEGVWKYVNEWKAQRPDLSPEEMGQIGEVGTLAEQLAQRALGFLQLEKKRPIFLDDTPLIEQRLHVALKGWDSFHGTADFVYEDLADGGTWVQDHKFRDSFTPKEAEEVDLQLAVYQMILLAHGIHTTGTVMYQIRRSLPAVPKQNKDGSMSRADIRTDWETYRTALVEAKLDPKDYLDMMDKLKDKEFFRADRHYRNLFTINAMWKQIVVKTAKDMLQPHSPTRHMNAFNCNGCWAREFCLGELYGSDNEFLLETSYINLKAPKPKLATSPTDFSFSE